ncbi:peptide methionine sulfoxide reductase isoform X1 [Diabrotica undecimpunctata]|uniref:peptide methionine sulfoxide reductase isoform X1 n=2 Tax=Diabrotica undecimpunctata TaxID=50387 RepID=UPI003B636407
MRYTFIQNKVRFYIENKKNKRQTKMSNILHEVDTPFEKATFGMGCFWANDALYGAEPGVLRTRVGYAGGTTEQPTYRSIGDHTEVIEIDFDPKAVSYEKLLNLFWKNHEYGLTTKIKKQYASVILYHNDEQKQLAEKSRKEEAEKHNVPLITDIVSAGPFYPAEDYHQKYRLQKHSLLCNELSLTPALLQKSHAAARLNGYVAGVGTKDELEKDLVKLGLSEKAAELVRNQFKENQGGGLYC